MPKTILSIFIGLVLLFFVLNRVLFFSPTILETTASKLVYPFIVVQNVCVDPIRRRIQHRETIRVLYAEIERLKEENKSLIAQVIKYEAQEQFLDDTKEVRAFKQRYATDMCILAQVIMKHIAHDTQYYFINAGSNKGVVKDLVAVYKNCLVGRVLEVYPCYSKVQLITDASCHVAIYCQKTKSLGIHVGTNNADITTLTHISHLAHIRDKDKIISSGDGLVFPKGFALGKIESSVVNGMYYEVKVKPLLDFQELSYCYVIQKGS